jgi:signal transduction histidine kinase
LAQGEVKTNLLESVHGIEENLFYINKIVADLQDFSRPLNPKKEQVDVEKIIYEALEMIVVPSTIKTIVSVQKDLPQLIIDSTLIKRILINLIQNAVQAMPNGGKLAVIATIQRGRIKIEIEDTGEGIPVEVQDKLFTPLITTKAKGQGFGLAVVKRMTEAMNGTVTFESEKGKGTKFIVQFPA